jgi:hypothetical protein
VYNILLTYLDKLLPEGEPDKQLGEEADATAAAAAAAAAGGMEAAVPPSPELLKALYMQDVQGLCRMTESAACSQLSYCADVKKRLLKYLLPFWATQLPWDLGRQPLLGCSNLFEPRSWKPSSKAADDAVTAAVEMAEKAGLQLPTPLHEQQAAQAAAAAAALQQQGMAADFQVVPAEVHVTLVGSKSDAAVRPQRKQGAQQPAGDEDPPCWQIGSAAWEGQLDQEASAVVLRLSQLLPARVNNQSLEPGPLAKMVGRFQIRMKMAGLGGPDGVVLPMARVVTAKQGTGVDVVLMADRNLPIRALNKLACPQHMITAGQPGHGLPRLQPADLYRLRFRVEPLEHAAARAAADGCIWMGLSIATWLLDAAGGIEVPPVFRDALSEAKGAAAAGGN